MAAAVASPTSSTASVAIDTPASADSVPAAVPAAVPIPKLVVITAPSNNGMSATFMPEELVDFYDDPNHTTLSPAEWREPEPDASKDVLSRVELQDVDWRQYEPPASMNKVANVTSEILLEIVNSSVENIKSRNEEARQAEADQQAQQETANEEARKSMETEEPYLPIIIEQEALQENEDVKGKGKGIEPDEPFVVPDPTMVDASKITSKKKFAIRKLFQRGEPQHEVRAESSSAGARREAMREYFEHRLSKVNQDSSHEGAQATLAILRRNKSVKVPEAQQLV